MTPDTTEAFPRDGMTAPLQAVPDETAVMPVIPETLPALPEPVTFAAFPWNPIGDALISSLPGFDSLPCGHCGAAFGGATADVLTEARVLGTLRYLAYEAGWQYDLSLIWTCPGCYGTGDDRAAAEARTEAEAVADAEHVHRSILAGFDHRASAAMEARGWEFTCRWSFESAAPVPARWAA
jgi:hypothetical protein